MKKNIFKSTLISILLFTSSNVFAECRFYAAISQTIASENIQNHLLKMPNSLKFLGRDYDNGWSVGFYTDKDIAIFRGIPASVDDQQYDAAVFEAASKIPKIVVGHLREASSGCVEGVANPHPFRRELDGRTWLFGHNGTIKKKILIELIGQDYLNAHPPTACADNPPDSWIDSELYFIFLLKKIEKNPTNVEAAIQEGLDELHTAMGNARKALNFFLTDGQSIWAYREGPTLYYLYQPETQFSAVASTPPEADWKDWMDVGNEHLVVLKPAEPPKIVSMPWSDKESNLPANISIQQAIKIAEQFIIDNGYTDQTADLNKFVPELLENPEDMQTIIQRRKSTVQSTAIGAKLAGDQWSITFPTTNNEASGRVVSMDTQGNNVKMQHQEVLIE